MAKNDIFTLDKHSNMVKFRYTALLLVALPVAQLVAQPSPFIHVDQFGYRTASMKVAVLSDPQEGYNLAAVYTPPSFLEVRAMLTDSVVMTVAPEVWNNGQVHNQSGDRGWWLDFSALKTPGRYFIYDPVNSARSADFSIGDDPYHDVLKTAGRMFFYNRCGAAKAAPFAESDWTDGPSFAQDAQTRFIGDPSNANLWKDMTGGWFDAGDYNKYVTFAYGPVHDLLWAWQENPAAFGDDWNLPESGNGIPDILDELKWELDWLWKMSNEDGSVHIKMGSQNYSENVSAPPSINADPRFYGPICTASSLAVAGMFAHAAWVYGSLPGYDVQAKEWSDRAEACFEFALPRVVGNTMDIECDNGAIVSGDADWDESTQLEAAVSASIYLYRQTAETSYHDFFLNYYVDTEPIEDGFWGPYRMPLTDALLLYLTLPDADTAASAAIFNSIQTEAIYNWNGFLGFNVDDLYRAYMPDWSYHWGSNLLKANYGILNSQLDRYSILPVDSLAYRVKAEEQLHYFHGVNPQGMVYLSNMYAQGASRCANEIYHTWFNDGTPWDNALTSDYGPAPGYVVGGANQYFSVTGLTPPYGQPAQKSYLDFNTGWPENSWEITEPAIYYQSAYLRLLAGFVKGEPASSIVDGPQEVIQDIIFHPNPAYQMVSLPREFFPNDIGAVYNSVGQYIFSWPRGHTHFDTSELPSGWYVVRFGNRSGRFFKG